MTYAVETLSGSLYVIDTENQTWKRANKTPKSGYLRSHEKDHERGTYHRLHMTVGQGMTLIMEPFLPQGPSRMIYTSDVVKITEMESQNVPEQS